MKKLAYIMVLLCASCLSLHAQTGQPDYDWGDIDFSDTALISSNVLKDKVINYLYANACVDEAHFDSLSKVTLDIVFAKAKVNMRTYEYLLELMLNGYTNMGREAVTEYLLNYPQLGEGEITMAEGLRLDSISEPFQKVRVGAKAPDFSGVTIDGKTYHLYESTAKNILVVFWSTDCEYCHDFLVQIRRHLNLKTDFELVTFALADNKEAVTKTVKKMRLPGYHFYDDLRWESKPFLDYHVTSAPTVFLLDEEKNIVCKPYDWVELEIYTKDNK